MLRIFFGFAIGLIVAAYTLPVIEKHFGKIPLPGVSKVVSNETTHTSNVINPVPPNHFTRTDKNFSLSPKVQTALSVIGTRPLDSATSDFVVGLITELVETEPGIQPFVRNRISGGLTNREALEIFEKYYAVQG